MKTIVLLLVLLAGTDALANVYLGTNVIYSGGGTSAPAATSGLRVRYIDYDGTILSTQFVATNGNATAPANPSHDLLTFQEWNIASTNITQDTDIGATYATTDGKTYVYLTVTTVTGTNCTLYLNKSDGSTLTLDWGDGTSTNITASGNLNTGAHAYPSNGYYVVTMYISSGGGTYGFGNGSSATAFCGGNVQATRDMMTSLLIGTNVTSLGNNAFYTCTALSSLTIPSGVTNIGASVFYQAYSLSSVTIPITVTSIGASAFFTCRSLSSITIPDSVTSIVSSAFESCYSLASITIPSGVTSIGANAFLQCYSLSSIAIPSAVTSIGAGAFRRCYSLAPLTLPSGVAGIGLTMFQDCLSISSLTIPIAVTSIGTNAFNGCSAISYFELLPTNPPALHNTNAFSGITSSTKIYVPDAYFDVYTNTVPWNSSPVPLLYLYPVSQKP